MDSEYIFIEMEPSTKDIGNRICKMGRELRLGLMEGNTKDNIKVEKNREKEYTYGQMVAIIQDYGIRIKFMGMVNIFG